MKHNTAKSLSAAAPANLIAARNQGDSRGKTSSCRENPLRASVPSEEQSGHRVGPFRRTITTQGRSLQKDHFFTRSPHRQPHRSRPARNPSDCAPSPPPGHARAGSKHHATHARISCPSFTPPRLGTGGAGGGASVSGRLIDWCHFPGSVPRQPIGCSRTAICTAPPGWLLPRQPLPYRNSGHAD